MKFSLNFLNSPYVEHPIAFISVAFITSFILRSPWIIADKWINKSGIVITGSSGSNPIVLISVF